MLSGSGVSWQDGACYDVAAGDCLVHTAGTEAHTLRAGADGLEVLAFGERHRGSGARLPRAGVSWGLGAWVRTGAEDEHPWALEEAAGEPEVGERVERPTLDRQCGRRRVGAIRSRQRLEVGRDLGRPPGACAPASTWSACLPGS